MRRFPHLFSPVSIGGLELANRVVLAPMATNYANENHQVTDRLIAYHALRARGGVGLSIVEHTAVDPLGLTGPRMLAIFDDSFIPGLTRLTEAVHREGGRIALQIQHGGPQASPETIGQQCVAPSAVGAGRDRRLPREMTVREIRHAAKAFADGAWRAQQAGFDGVEVHMAHGYLGCAFLSPYLNQRTDSYGGDVTRRTRFAFEVIEATKRRCGREFPVWCRISADEFIEGGQTLEQAQQTALLLQDHGYCAIHVSAAIGATAHYASAPHLRPEGHLLHLAEGISRVVDVPVIGVGNIRHPEFAEDAIARGRCELVALGRQLLADPDWCAKARDGRAAEIIPCILCNLGCSDRRHSPQGLCECVTNPLTGHESEWTDWPTGPPAAVNKKVLVVGGGPAGVSAAVAAARRGHSVSLWEAGPTLGGRVATMSYVDRSSAYQELTYSMATALDDARVKVSWQKAADSESIAEFAPDAVVIATGSRPLRLDEALIEECDGEYLAAAEYLRDPMRKLQPRVAVLGGDETGCMAALALGHRGHHVMLFEREEILGPGMVSAMRPFIQEQLQACDVEVFLGCEVKNVRESITTVLVRGEERKQFPAAEILVALGRASVNDLARLEQDLSIPVYVIGDALQPRTLHDAVWEGAEVGRKI